MNLKAGQFKGYQNILRKIDTLQCSLFKRILMLQTVGNQADSSLNLSKETKDLGSMEKIAEILKYGHVLEAKYGEKLNNSKYYQNQYYYLSRLFQEMESFERQVDHINSYLIYYGDNVENLTLSMEDASIILSLNTKYLFKDEDKDELKELKSTVIPDISKVDTTSLKYELPNIEGDTVDDFTTYDELKDNETVLVSLSNKSSFIQDVNISIHMGKDDNRYNHFI